MPAKPSKSAISGLLLVMLLGCQSASDTGVTSVQFEDLPVPDGMTLATERSHSYEAGSFRHAHYEYYGNTPVAEAAEYVRERMRLEGWNLDRAEDDPRHVALRFSRTPYTSEFVIRRDQSLTRMTVDYTTPIDDSGSESR